MDKNILKKFAMESRSELMEKVKNKLDMFYIDEDFSKKQTGELIILSNDKHSLTLTRKEFEHREKLMQRITDYSDNNEIDKQGIEGVIEEVAYTWFNRIIAIRYMEVNDITPISKNNESLGFRILSSKDNQPDPEILKFSNLNNTELDIQFDKERYLQLNDDNKKFNLILIAVCNKLGKVIPQVFDGQTDYIDILIPDNLLNDTGFITKVVKEVPEEYWKEQVEIIGWLYQYWNTNDFNRIYDGDMSNRKIEAKDIPAATQLFTPEWVVKYMVENSLGRYWVEKSGDLSIADNWKYFIKDNIDIEDNKISTVKDINNMTIKDINSISANRLGRLSPEEITFFDPCCGSGHILVYAFELLYQIYVKQGYNKNDIPELILKNNLYGLDIDDRAGQLSVLSVILKSRKYDKNIFSKETIKNLNIMSIQDSKTLKKQLLDKNLIKMDSLEYLIDTFKNAKEIGSLLIVDKKDYTELNEEIEKKNSIFGYYLNNKIEKLSKQAQILSKKFNIVVTNPPYMNKSKMTKHLIDYCDENLKIAKGDMATAFYYDYLQNKISDNGYLSMVTTISWMYIKTFEELRTHMLENYDFISLVDFRN